MVVIVSLEMSGRRCVGKESADARARIDSGEIGDAPHERHQSPTSIENDREVIGNQGLFMAVDGRVVAVKSDSKNDSRIA